MNMLFETRRLYVRRFEEDDADMLYEVLSDPDVMEYIEEPFDREKTKHFIQEYGCSEEPAVYAVIRREDERLIGHLIFHVYDEDASEIGWVLAQDCWQNGYATELTAACVSYAKEHGIRELVMECDKKQRITVHIADAFGFEKETDGDRLIFRLRCKAPDLWHTLMFAYEKHLGQRDKGNNPYILHPVCVALLCETEDEKTVALLHDVMEDCGVTAEDLRAMGYSNRIIRAVEALTRRIGEDYMDFIRRAKQNPIAAKVKMADLINNSEIDRIPEPTEKDYARLEKYRLAMQELLKED